ncbi:MAG: error-prone DNA polymerase [Betaproteobacteria bacterium]|nr:error-prone DNA polymerase [Betaproteobacteria bacterium]
MLPAYAELHCISNFSFLRGASHPEELVDRARELGYAALALTDECSLAGVVRAHLQARTHNFPLLIGAEFSLHSCIDPTHTGSAFHAPGTPGAHSPAPRLVLLARHREGYGRLSELISAARARAPKGHYQLLPADLDDGVPGCTALLVPAQGPIPAQPGLAALAPWLRERFTNRAWLAVELLAYGHDSTRLEQLRALGRASGLPLAAAGDVHMHRRSRKPLHDTLTAIRLGQPVARCGHALAPNAEQHLRSRLRLASLYPAELLEETLEIAACSRFSLDELRYEYPDEIVPPGHTPASWLRELVDRGLPGRYPAGIPATVREQIEHELTLISELRYEPYFLTVADIVHFARSRNILCQGRGSAANSAVCYALGITEVDPARLSVLFERFISRERNEPPDIDVDFEHQRREEVIQYLYRKYGRHRAALAATVIRYRTRSALRDVGKALAIDATCIERLAGTLSSWRGAPDRERLTEAGLNPDSPVVTRWLELVRTLQNFPRHLSQHTGGFVIARDRLTRLVPVENAAMAERTVIEWDKDDLDALGLLKVDVLALGMLSAIRRALDLITFRRDPWRRGNHRLAGAPPIVPFRIQDIPSEDPATYEMISRADTVGVFQIESRAQMSMLPRLQPRCFYDLVIEVAIVRPGPIQGGMVHPYLRRRQGLEPVDYPRDEIRPALERTLGVPIFQEQVMQIAMLAAGFSAGEADQLRRAMAAWRRKGGLDAFQQRVVEGMLARGYAPEFAQRIFSQIEGFGEYGFPESHAASFALLVYVSCWIKRHEPAAFLAAMLNSQPLGFYAPAQLVRDARAHGIEVRPVDVLVSQAQCTLEEFDEPNSQPAVRLGLAQVRSLSAAATERILAARDQRLQDPARSGGFAFDDVDDLAQCAQLDATALRALADSGALLALAGHRRQAYWAAAAGRLTGGFLDQTRIDEAPVTLATPSEGEDTIADYRSLGIPMGRHPLALLRAQLDRLRIEPASALAGYPDGRIARASGLVTHRQRPETARGTLFVTLEDDTGTVNVIVWPAVFERFRAALLGAQLMSVYGYWQRQEHGGGTVTHLVAARIIDHTALLGALESRSRNFR